MYTSNINITPNIYIRNGKSISDDLEYIKHITGAKRLKNIKNYAYNVHFTEIQKRIIDEFKICSYATNGEMSYGPINKDNKLIWVCRCEVKDCSHYKSCINYPNSVEIFRDKIIKQDIDDNDSLEKFIRNLGIVLDGSKFEVKRNKAITNQETLTRDYKKPEEPKLSDLSLYEYKNITDSECIINAPLNSHIILNSGPGTGKTYTIIQRLVYILENNLCPADEIYVLCYTRSAKKIIEDKLDSAIAEGTIPVTAKNINILTFDSYATYFLLAIKEELKEDFTKYGYNDRIKMFNEHIIAEDFENVSYFVVDEIQDLVNERAEMVLNILKYLKCGFLLAGDRCQSIYDYEVDYDATLDSAKFYQIAEENFPNDIQRYEISVNKRQIESLAIQSSKMRNVLLHSSISEQNMYANSIMKQYETDKKIEKYIREIQQEITVPTAILCRNNGDTEYVSGLLCKRKINHSLNRGVNNSVSLPKWIADVFWDYCRDTISKNDFIERFSFRCNSPQNSEIIWELLCKISGSNSESNISLENIRQALLLANNLPTEFFNKEPLLTVSTIHKAKGSEFDDVILIDSDIENSDKSAEEARIRYVALTRPKKQFRIMKKNKVYFKHTASGRIIRTGIHSNIYGINNKYCRNIVLGLPDDIDDNSFVLGELTTALSLQEYISKNINKYDEIIVERIDNSENYKIIHNDTIIGLLSQNMINEMIFGLNATDYKNNLPYLLTDLYISKITTKVLKKFDSNISEEFQKSKICYGIQITGLARLNFKKEDMNG